MKNIFEALTKKGLSVLLLTVISGMTLFTTVSGAVKVADNINSFKPDVPEVKTVEAVLAAESKKAVPAPANTSLVKKPVAKSVTGVSPAPTAATVAQQTQTTAQAANANACIVTLFGKQYDVQTLRSTHPGGDVFVCNTDQTALYQGKHGTNVNQMQKYLVTAGSTTTGNPAPTGSSPTGTGNGSDNHEKFEKDDDIEEHDDEEDEEHFEEREDSEKEQSDFSQDSD